ncbi:FHA domain-containing protein [Streptomyces sp. NBC_00344]|uniref:FHA domain-containing protein n=1 Tax=Streptomyces sp. NBC_00344 TaxID=2975720 RepID=UPI002E1F3875
MPTCPNGHQSGSDDWCEVCGHRMGAVPPPPPPPPPYAGGGAPQQPQQSRHPAAGYGYPQQPTAQAELCPQCRTPRETGAPFCEECRWNFLTNTATSYTPVAPNLPQGFQSQQPPRPPDAFDYQSSRPSQMNRPAEPLTGDPSMQQGPPPSPYQQQSGPQPPPSFAQQQSGPPPPPSFAQPPRAPQAPQQPHQPSADDWLLPPPSRAEQQGQQPPPQVQQAQHQQPQHFQPPQQQQQPQVPQQPQGAGDWSLTVGPDREYFMAMMQRSGPEATGLNLPAYSPEQQLPLTGGQITIGRRRHSTGESPDIDLSVPPEDPGVSHQHAVLVQQPDGSWAVVDQNSTNGTTVNGAEDPIQPYVPVQLEEGDRVHVGAWTTITIRRG